MDGSTIKNCTNKGNIFCGYQQGGGIAGVAVADSVILNCMNEGSVTVLRVEGLELSGEFAGGILGRLVSR